MKGLILKDLLNLGSNKRIFLSLLVMFVFFGFINSDSSVSMLSIYLPTMSVMFAISTFSYDEYSKWDRYALALPLTRKDIVSARYIFTGCLFLTGYVIAISYQLIIMIFFKINIELLSLFIEPLLSLLIVAIFVFLIMPVIYRYGAEKGRLMMFAGAVFIGISSVLIMSLFKNNSIMSNGIDNIFSFLNQYGFYLLLFIATLLMFISFRLSLRFYQAKEF